jgi:hypothetical protein
MTEAVLDQSARVTRIQAPISSPGHCALCGKSDHPEGFAATDNLDFEFFGTFYLCADCVGDYAKVFGFMSKPEFADLLAKQQAMSIELETLREAVANLENILDAYAKLRPNSGIPDHRAVSDVMASEDANEGTSNEVGEQLQLGTSEQPVSPESAIGAIGEGAEQSNESDESSSEQGRDIVSSPSSNVVALFDELGLS